MADVFISYSRKNKDFVIKLHEALSKFGKTDWVDWEDIPPAAAWREEIKSAIQSSDSFVFVISEASAASNECLLEIEHAVKQNKRLIPLVREKVDDKVVHEKLRIPNWIFFCEDDDFESSFKKLVNAINTDLEWVKSHTRLLIRAIEWESKGRDESFLLQGSDLKDAENWLFHGMEKDPRPNLLQAQYIAKSREHSEHQKDVTLKAIYRIIYDIPKMLANFPETAEIREKFVTDSLQQLEEWVRLSGQASEFLREFATNYRLLGDILIELNQLDKARKAFQKSVEYSSQLIFQSPDEALYQRDLAVSYYNVGVTFENQGNLPEARKEYMAAYEPAKKAAEIDPGRWKELFDDIQRKISHSVN